YLSRYWMDQIKNIPKVRFNTSFDPAQMCAIANMQIEGLDQGKIGSYLFSQHHIFTTPIVHEEFQGLRITPNLYTTLPELNRFCVGGAADRWSLSLCASQSTLSQRFGLERFVHPNQTRNGHSLYELHSRTMEVRTGSAKERWEHFVLQSSFS